MKRNDLLLLLQDYRKGKLFTPGVTGGGDEAGVTPDEQRMKETIFLDYLKQMIRNNNLWLVVLYAVLIGLIIFLLVILWRKQDDQKYFFGILTGQGLSVLFCVNRLSYFYKNKRSSEILLYLYSAAKTPEQKEKIVDEIVDFLKVKKAKGE